MLGEVICPFNVQGLKWQTKLKQTLEQFQATEDTLKTCTRIRKRE